MKQRANRKTHHRRVQLQMVVLLLLFTLLTTLLTGWITYDRTSEQVIRDTWQQQEALLRSACSAVNREIEQIKSFSWQLSNDNGVQRYLHLTEQTPGYSDQAGDHRKTAADEGFCQYGGGYRRLCGGHGHDHHR